MIIFSHLSNCPVYPKGALDSCRCPFRQHVDGAASGESCGLNHLVIHPSVLVLPRWQPTPVARSWRCQSWTRRRNVLICILLPLSCQLKLHIPFLLRHRNPSPRASGPSPLFRTCLTNLLSLSNIGAAWVSTLESVAPRCPLNLAAQTSGPDGPDPGGMAADGGVEDIRKKRNGQDSFFFNKHLTLHQEPPTQYSLAARSASASPCRLAGEDGHCPSLIPICGLLWGGIPRSGCKARNGTQPNM